MKKLNSKPTSWVVLSSCFLHAALPQAARGQICGAQANGALCPGNYCCSQYGWCGSSSAYCGAGCQSGPCQSNGDDGTNVVNYNYCGSSWVDANSKCGTACPLGNDDECPSGQSCYADCTACSATSASDSDTNNDNDGVTYNYNYCGISWTAANSDCGTSCPKGTDEECPTGQACYADCTGCSSVMVGTFSPTVSSVPTTSPQPSNPPYTSAPFSIGDCEAVRNTVNFGYYQSWAIYRNSNCNPIWPGSIDVASFGYTHLAYSFAGISTSGLIEAYNGDTSQYSMYSLFNSLKSSNPGLKTLIAIGGWTFDQTRFSYASATADRRKRFADSVVSFLERHGFDGIDIDWEYPVTRQGTPADYANYPLLCQALRTAFDNAGHTDWLITIATSINADKLAQGYDMPGMVPHISWFNVMSYDIHGAWDTIAGANTDMEYIKNTMQYIFNLGVPREKLVLGMAAYGRSTRLSSTSCTTAGCPISGAGLTGCPTEPGFLPYFEIDDKYVRTGNYDSLIFNPTSGSMELVTGGNRYFTSFDSPDTFDIKYKYAYEDCMRGMSWWAVDMIKSPLSFSHAELPTASPSISNEPSLSSLPSLNPSTSIVPSLSFYPTIEVASSACSDGCPFGYTGLLPSSDCSQFFVCSNGLQLGVIPCPTGTLFDVNTQVCNWASNVVCSCSAAEVPKPSLSPVALSMTSLSSCGECPVDYSGMIPSNECGGYHFCMNGVLSAEIKCPSGLLYDANIDGCNWNYLVSCKCSEIPNHPLSSSTADDGFALWYPDWARTNTCQNDGQQSPWMESSHLFLTKRECCDAFFHWDVSCAS